VTKHICNTGGIERFKNAQYDMVRLGVGLYGMAIDPQNHDQLEVVSSLFSIVVQVKKVSTGESIGYGRNFMVEKPMKIAIIPIGYADGLDRRLGNGVGYVYVSGKKRKILGNICMDLIMVDVTGLPTQVNERVELFGQNIRVQDIAQQINTISYEILTSIPPRVKRVYIKETV
jgi:alanine racemase